MAQSLALKETSVDDGSSALLPFDTLYNGVESEFKRSWQVPTGFSELTALEALITRDYIGNIYADVLVERVRPGSATTSDSTGYAALAVAVDDGTYAYLTISTAAFNGLSIQAGDILNFRFNRDASHASDTYEADLKFHGFRATYNTTPTPSTGLYCSVVDIENRLSVKTTAELSDDTNIPPTAVNDTIVDLVIERASREIDNFIGTIAVVPLTTVPDKIRFLCIDLSCYYLMERRFTSMNVPDDWKATKDKVLEQLAKIQSLELEAGLTIAYKQADMTVPTTDPIVDFNNDDNDMSWY